MKHSIKQALIGAAAMLAMTGVNAATDTISLIPLDPSVNVGDTFDITVRGTNFNNGVSGGSVTISWDQTTLGLVSTEADITTSANSNSFTDLFAPGLNPVKTPGNLEATYGTFSPIPSEFDFFTLTFIALPPASVSSISVGLGLFGDWQDGFFEEILNVNYVGTEVTVNAVPIPAAAWLFGSALLGLAGVARRRSCAA